MKNFKKNGGFTLVELIVVIAILAILAAVAIPAYSGYIEKANAAGDQTLLSAVNRAFTSALTDQGFSPVDVGAAAIPVDDSGKIGSNTMSGAAVQIPQYISSVSVSNGTIDLRELNVSFAMYFAGNETAAFKTIAGRDLFFNPLTLSFIDVMNYDGEVAVSYKGSSFTVSAAVVKQLANSTYGEIGAEDLLGKVDFASGLCVALVGNRTSPLYNTVRTDEYKQAMATAMGFANVTEYNNYLNSLSADDRNAFLSNSLVLTAAQNSSTMVNDTLLTNLAAGSINTNVNSVNAIAETAAVYALYTAYAQDKGLSTDDITGNSSLNSALLTDDFKKYAASDAAKADLDAYLSAMNMVNSATQGNAAGTKDVLTNGFADAELVGMLGSLMGK